MTQRLFRLNGNRVTSPSTGSVTVNGIEVFNGAFGPGSLIEGTTEESDDFLCEFTYEIDDSAGTNIQLPVAVTVATGDVTVGMLRYNYAITINPALTPEELAYVTAGTTASSPGAVRRAVDAKGGWLAPSETVFAYGLGYDLQLKNRTAIALDGVTIADEIANWYIPVPAGSVLTFTTTVFSSVNPPAPV